MPKMKFELVKPILFLTYKFEVTLFSKRFTKHYFRYN